MVPLMLERLALSALLLAGVGLGCTPRASLAPPPTAPAAPAAARAGAPTPAAAAPASPATPPPRPATPRGEDALTRRYEDAPALLIETGQASYYSDALAGRRTASGAPYDPSALTAAHRTWPFGTVVRVVREPQGPSVVVRITDRGPFGSRRRVIDLSRAAASALELLRAGVAPVRLEVLAWPER